MAVIITLTELSSEVPIQDLSYHLAASINNEYISFLDSSLLPSKYSRFSYLAWEPDFAIYGNNSSNIMSDFKGSKSGGRLAAIKQEGILKNGNIVEEGNPIAYLRKIFSERFENKIEKYLLVQNGRNSGRGYEISNVSNAKTPDLPDFTGGFIGYFSYDLKNFIEALPSNAARDIDIPVYYLVYYSKLLAFCHKTGKLFYIRMEKSKNGYGGNITKDAAEEAIFESGMVSSFIKAEAKKNPPDLQKHIENKYLIKPANGFDLKSNFEKPGYIEAVKKAKKYIHEGEIYQVNMTQRFDCRLDVPPWDLYYILRIKNPAPFCAFLKFPEFCVGSSSPERFLKLKNRTIQTRPIKGTRPRGTDLYGDRKNAEELLKSIKDRAELNMIVDLERNDLGRFCRYGTVRVKEHAVVEKYARVFHLVSTITGQVRKGHDIADILRATFPGGSITGAPKIRAMEIIDELENVARNIYTGALGYIGSGPVMDLNIVIRTFIIKDGHFYYNVGGGIVEDSEPESEYQETLDKGSALQDTLEFFTKKTPVD
jgi:para-aminobenzoate synthetase component 1